MKNHFFFSPIFLCSLLVMLYSCSKKDGVNDPGVAGDTTNILGINVSDNFNYQTTVNTSLDVLLLTNDNKPLAGVMVNILDKSSEEGGSILYTAISDLDGKISGDVNIPSYFKTVVVDPSYIGLMHNATVTLTAGKIFCTLGGSEGYLGNVVPNARVAVPDNQGINNGRTAALAYHYFGTYNSSGKPDYLVPSNDVISSKRLSYINSSLPEQKPVPAYHPDYLKNSNSTNIHIVKSSTIWITFVHEGAGYQNSLAYFTYPTLKPPTSTAQIDSLIIILPNASLSGSGGALNSGNKIKIGKFEPGTSIGFCLIANGWSDVTKTVGNGINKFYSIDELNPEPAALKRHTVLLYDEEDRLMLSGFEDQNRDGYSDNDFNDLIFYTTANPENGIETANIAPIDRPGDKDGDGVGDVYDKFPNDPLRAYINTYPSPGSYASIAFEDTWPNTGDYDMNDLVIEYQYSSIVNAQNKTIEMYANYVCKASGAGFKNGFGVQFPFAPAKVASATGTRVTNNNTVTLNLNGCETGQSKAVIIPFDDIYALMPTTGNNFINTQPGVPFNKPDTVKMKLTFTSPMTAIQLGAAPFNQFIILNKIRGKEAHLPGEIPTDKASTSIFNTFQDNTIPSQLKYYKTKKNLPFAISIPQKFDYPFEGKMMTTVYLKFAAWAESGGGKFADWYLDSSGYRSKGFIYK